MAIPEIRWGVIGTGWISSMFIGDLLAARPDAPANHIFAAIGSSSMEKGNDFVTKLWKDAPNPKPVVYDSYSGVYNDPKVDIVYIGTPHVLHKQNCLDAIAAGKHVLCEKPFTMNEREAKEVVDAARAKGVFLMEAVWTRFFPMITALQDHIHVKKSIGKIQRAIIEFGMGLDWNSLPSTSRLKDPALGGGALLDIGIYTLTYASLVMGNQKTGLEHPKPDVLSSMTIVNGVDESDVNILRYAAGTDEERTAICMSTVLNRSPRDFARIEGSEGTITLFADLGPSCPSGFKLKKKGDDAEEQEFKFDHPKGTYGFIYEADAVAIDIANGKKENDIMPLDETLRIMGMMDTIRKQNNLVYPPDKE